MRSQMKPNLDVLKPEIEQYLEDAGIAVFYGYSRRMDDVPEVYWDCDQYPDYRLFVQSARAAGAKLLVFHQREFFSEQVDDSLERLQACELGPQESRSFEERLNEFRSYEGSVCAIELSFDHAGCMYMFELRTDWYDEFTELIDEIQLLASDDDDSDESPISGYFSRN